jgi:thiamine biosynthesis lipoprotein
MGMPISLALRGRHAVDEAGRSAWIRVVASLREADLVFSTYRPDSVISRLGRGEIGPSDCPPEVAEVLRLGEIATTDSHGAFDVRRPGPDGRTVLDPAAWSRGGPSSGPRRPCGSCRTPTSASPRAAISPAE